MFQKGIVHKHKAGRPKGFKGVARDIMRRTKNGKDLVDFAMKIFTDEKQVLDWRWEAFQWLSDRGLGRPVQMLELEAALAMDETEKPGGVTLMRERLALLDHDQRAALRDIVNRMHGGRRPELVEVKTEVDHDLAPDEREQTDGVGEVP